VAIVLGYDTRWAMMATMGTSQAEALSEARRYHAALARLNVSTDGLDPRERLSRYRLVIAPALYCVDSDTAENLRRFVAEGGVLCVTPRSGIVDEYGKAFAEPAPGPLGAVAGVQIDERYALKGTVRIAGQTSSIRERTFVASVWADEMELVGAECVASYAEGVFRGRPAITTHRYGRGYVVVVGTVLQDESLVEFVSWLLAEAGVARRLADCNGLRLLERGSYNLRVLFALNFTEEPRSIGLGDVWRDVFTGERCDSVAVPPADVRILSRRQ